MPMALGCSGTLNVLRIAKALGHERGHDFCLFQTSFLPSPVAPSTMLRYTELDKFLKNVSGFTLSRLLSGELK
jgi:hypothetical protein